jgi:hypothetical protein
MSDENKPKRAVTLNPQRIGLAEQLRRDWVVNAAAGTTINDVLQPAFWAHCSQEFTVYDRIDCRVETGEWALDLIVLDVGRNYARVFVAHRHVFEEAELPEAPMDPIEHKVEYKGPHLKFCVIRQTDGAVVQEGIKTEKAAVEWMQNHMKITAV